MDLGWILGGSWVHLEMDLGWILGGSWSDQDPPRSTQDPLKIQSRSTQDPFKIHSESTRDPIKSYARSTQYDNSRSIQSHDPFKLYPRNANLHDIKNPAHNILKRIPYSDTCSATHIYFSAAPLVTVDIVQKSVGLAQSSKASRAAGCRL